MQHKFFYIILLLIIIQLFAGCDDNTSNPVDNQPRINEIEPQHTFHGDTLTIFGKNFGLPTDSSFVEIDTVRLRSDSCQKWTNSVIKFIITYDMNSSNLAIRIGQTISNIVAIEIEQLEEIDTIIVSAGTFEMGSESGFSNEMPVHQVQLTNDFICNKFEITQSIFEKVMRYNNSTHLSPDFPVDNVSWSEAAEFCNRLSIIHKLEPCYFFDGSNWYWDLNAKGWRLPTEAEWEYLCRSGTNDDFSGNLDDMGFWNGNSGDMPHPVGQKQPNNFGLYDMHGNVWEWCWDYYDPDYYQISETINPIGPEQGIRHVIRGGSWMDGNIYSRSANRTIPDREIDNIGIRIIRNK